MEGKAINEVEWRGRQNEIKVSNVEKEVGREVMNKIEGKVMTKYKGVMNKMKRKMMNEME